MAVPTRMDKYRAAGKAFTNVAIDQSLMNRIDAIAKGRGDTRTAVVAAALEAYAEHYPAIKRAAEIERAWCYTDVERVIALQGPLTDAEYAARLGIAERTWIEIRERRSATFAVLRNALRKHPELLDGRN